MSRKSHTTKKQKSKKRISKRISLGFTSNSFDELGAQYKDSRCPRYSEFAKSLAHILTRSPFSVFLISKGQQIPEKSSRESDIQQTTVTQFRERLRDVHMEISNRVGEGSERGWEKTGESWRLISTEEVSLHQTLNQKSSKHKSYLPRDVQSHTPNGFAQSQILIQNCE